MDFSFSFQISIKRYKTKKFPQQEGGAKEGVIGKEDIKMDTERWRGPGDRKKPRMAAPILRTCSRAYNSGQPSQQNTGRLESKQGHQTGCLIKGLSTEQLCQLVSTLKPYPLHQERRTIRYLPLSEVKHQKTPPKGTWPRRSNSFSVGFGDFLFRYQRMLPRAPASYWWTLKQSLLVHMAKATCDSCLQAFISLGYGLLMRYNMPAMVNMFLQSQIW